MLNFRIFRGSTSNVENLVRENFCIIMHIRRDINGIHENCFPEILKIANPQILTLKNFPLYSGMVMAGARNYEPPEAAGGSYSSASEN